MSYSWEFQEEYQRLNEKDEVKGELTPKKLLKVSCRLDKKSDIRALGLQLGVEEYKINTIFENYSGHIEDALYEMLKEWRKGQRNNKEAYTNLWAALTHPEVNLRSVAHEALESDLSIIDDHSDVHRKRAHQKVIHRMNKWKTNEETPESGKRLRLEEEDEDLLPVKPVLRYWWDRAFARVLVDEDLDRIAASLDKDDIYRLGKQLEIHSTEIDTSFAKHCPPAKEPIFKVLESWLKRQTDRHEAYIAMGKALIHPSVRLNLIAKEVLDYPPAEQQSGSSSCADSVSRECTQCKGTNGTSVNGIMVSS